MLVRRFKLTIWLAIVSSVLIGYQNCSNDYKISTPTAINTAAIQDFSASVPVTASKANPQLDLFFVIDNSGSMLGNQINLGNAFSSVFQNNISSLADFDVNIYVFSTASTYNASYESQIPTALQASITSIPALSDVTDLVQVPGSIFGIQNTPTGTFGTAPYTMQLNPAPVLAFDPTQNAVTASLHIAKQGNQSASEYAANIQALTTSFQNRLSYLNPTNQLAYEPLTDISSGLCSIARILKHSSNYVNAGDAAAFVIVSDDNDRLNTRNPNGNQCIEAISAADQVVDGTCGHDQTVYTYDTADTITYQTDSKFNYQSGTQINYSYTSGDTCKISYNNGYNYTSTYTQLQTTVTYTACTQMADGTCIAQNTGATAVVKGNYVGSGNACTQDMTSLVTSPVAGTTFTCVASNKTNQTGTSGIDSASNGSTCSSAVMSSLTSDTTKTNVSCTIGTASTATKTTGTVAVGACASYCSSNSSTYPNCTLLATNTVTTTGNFKLPTTVGATCSSQCPVSGTCGSGTISSYISSTYGATAVCGTPTAIMSVLVVNAADTSSGSALTCSSSLSGLNATLTTATGTAVCSGQSTVQTCINSLQNGGTPITACSTATGDKTTMAGGVGVTCTTACGSSNGLCNPATDATVAAYLLRTKGASCLSAANGGAKTLTLQFNNTTAPTASCSTPCSQTMSGSCDGVGWGATDGSTIATYIQSQLGGGTTCSAVTSYIADTASMTVDAANTGSACTSSTSPIFQASDSAHSSTAAVNYVTGDVNHLAADFENYILSESKAVFGPNNIPAVAVITHLAADTSLQGTDVGQDYINLASVMGSSQVTSVLANYSQSLAEISNFIVTSTLNSFVLPIKAGSVVYSVSIATNGSGASTPLDASLWTWSGGTLSINPSAGLKIGDQIIFNYHD